MFKLIYSAPNAPDRLHIAELSVQCMLARNAYAHLAKYISVVGRREGHPQPLDYSPLDILSYGVSFLAAIAAISKILFPGKKDFACDARGERLRLYLQIDDLPNIRSRDVRNSFEHIDERIDALSVQLQERDIHLIDLTADSSNTSIVLKRVNPRLATIEFNDQRVDIEQCYAEVEKLRKAVAAVSLQVGQ